MTTTIFDIETAGLPPSVQLEKFEPTFTPDARLKDPEKIKVDLADKQQDWLDKAALDASRARILCIGIMQEDGTVLFEGNEATIIKLFWDRFNSETVSFIGHNVKSFDIPFIVRRSFILGIAIAPGLVEGRYLSRRIIDTMEIWGCGEYGARISLDNLARALGVGKKAGSGKDFAALYESDNATALEYLKKDLELTQKCAQKLGIA